VPVSRIWRQHIETVEEFRQCMCVQCVALHRGPPFAGSVAEMVGGDGQLHRSMRSLCLLASDSLYSLVVTLVTRKRVQA
jgi:hypothetical protein